MPKGFCLQQWVKKLKNLIYQILDKSKIIKSLITYVNKLYSSDCKDLFLVLSIVSLTNMPRVFQYSQDSDILSAKMQHCKNIMNVNTLHHRYLIRFNRWYFNCFAVRSINGQSSDFQLYWPICLFANNEVVPFFVKCVSNSNCDVA